MSSLTFTVAGKPIPLPRSRSAAGKRPYIPEEAPVRGWQAQVKAACSNEIVRREWPKPCFTGDVSMGVTIWGARANADLDNIFKAIADALKGTAYRDDCQIAKLIIWRWKADAAHPPGAYIEIEEIA